MRLGPWHDGTWPTLAQKLGPCSLPGVSRGTSDDLLLYSTYIQGLEAGLIRVPMLFKPPPPARDKALLSSTLASRTNPRKLGGKVHVGGFSNARCTGYH